MARNAAYREAEQKIKEALRSGATELDLTQEYRAEDSKKLTELPDSLWKLTALQSLNLSHNQLTALPEAIGQLTALQSLTLFDNQLTALPEAIGQLTALQSLNLSNNQLTALPEAISQLTQLQSLDLAHNQLTALPSTLGQLNQLRHLILFMNALTDLPDSFAGLVKLAELSISKNQFIYIPECVFCLLDLTQFYAIDNAIKIIPDQISNLTHLEILEFGGEEIASNAIFGDPKGHGNRIESLPLSLNKLTKLRSLGLDDNPLNSELAAAYEQGLDAVKAYLRAKAEEQIVLNEAKLILVGEGEVGKTCLMDALAGAAWQEHASTHGIQIRPVAATDLESGRAITLNGWDFGGQRVYRPTSSFLARPPSISSSGSRARGHSRALSRSGSSW